MRRRRAQALVAFGLVVLMAPIYAAANAGTGQALDRFVYMPYLSRPVVTVVTVVVTLTVGAVEPTSIPLEAVPTPAGEPTAAPWNGLELTATAVDGVPTLAPTVTPTIEPSPTLPPFPDDLTATPALRQ